MTTLHWAKIKNSQNQEPEQFLEFIKELWLDHIRGADLLFLDYVKEDLYDKHITCL